MTAQTFPIPAALGGFGQAIARKPRWLLGVVAGLVIIAIVVATVALRSGSATQYVSQPVLQQTLVDSVTASGTVNPQNTISVGTQVSGTISQLDVDYNSTVKEGEVLARLDPTLLNAQLAQANAALSQAEAQADAAGASATGASSGVAVAVANNDSAKAAIASAQANITKAQSAEQLAQLTEQRDAALLAQGYVAQNQVDTDKSNVAQDQSAVAAAQSALAQQQAVVAAQSATVAESSSTASGSAATMQAAQAAVQSAQANVEEAQYNLDHSVITSPVNGTVIARDVSIGQTVAASLSTPTLFSIAQNLAKMEVDINVGEPDIGNVKAGDTVNFSVLAYPNQTFTGSVEQVRINPQTLNNVVTYDVVVDVNNIGNQLLPGMTANATIFVASAQNALVVPVAALQFTPHIGHRSQGAQGAATSQSAWGTVNGASGGTAAATGATGTLWVQNGKRITPVQVKIGLTTVAQDAVTPVQPGALKAGDLVIVGSTAGSSHSASSVRSPLSGSPAGGYHGGGLH